MLCVHAQKCQPRGLACDRPPCLTGRLTLLVVVLQLLNVLPKYYFYQPQPCARFISLNCTSDHFAAGECQHSIAVLRPYTDPPKKLPYPRANAADAWAIAEMT